MSQQNMFWEIVSEDVREAPDKTVSADHEREWRVKKDKMQKTRRTVWPDLRWSQRSLQLREGALRDFWEILVDDKLFYREATCKHANVFNPKPSALMP